MSLATIQTRASVGLNAPMVHVEVHLSSGLPAFHLVGLPEAAVKESKDRVRSAIINSQFDFPASRITVNLAPADLPKEGGRFDLAIALGILLASKQIKCSNIDHYEFLGELALSGHLRPVRAVISSAQAAVKDRHLLIVAKENGPQAAMVSEKTHFIANHLLDVCAHLQGQQVLPQCTKPVPQPPNFANDFADVKGQLQAKKALEVAAAGGHHLLMSGPPGCGKSMLAARLPSILPMLNEQQAIAKSAVESLCHSELNWQQLFIPSFRAPHHSASSVALVGGGNPPKPGEISLAHLGVLFLDELPEFIRPVLEALREPLENRHITISRANQQAVFPADFQLIAAMNPCPCGGFGSLKQTCRCTPERIRRYQQKISGPLLDRFDIHLSLQETPKELIINPGQVTEASSESIAKRVLAAKAFQYERQGKSNHLLSSKELQQQLQLNSQGKQCLSQASEKLGLSARAIQKTMRVARTLADLKQQNACTEAEILEALSFRQSLWQA